MLQYLHAWHSGRWADEAHSVSAQQCANFCRSICMLHVFFLRNILLFIIIKSTKRALLELSRCEIRPVCPGALHAVWPLPHGAGPALNQGWPCIAPTTAHAQQAVHTYTFQQRNGAAAAAAAPTAAAASINYTAQHAPCWRVCVHTQECSHPKTSTICSCCCC